ncbi:hypothetical protein FBD94_09890 [Pedobacter hiemivivus]|uniref:Uncharacterized protein n=1 Tax=Pedobacter hiemivivus TaxID=2530454 RepID=A0A4U1GEJ1_9SPHI|nr:hypothetical protein [Pedobacter hiemivivus]TKC62515.1 hypothetical protein FBD94_09890 [Pedobacter hiemivivus]
MKIYYKIIVITVSCIVVLGILNFISTKPNRHKNGFNRTFLKKPRIISTKYLGDNTKFYISGSNANLLYLTDYIDPNTLLVNDFSSQSITKIKLTIPEKEKIAWGVLKIEIDSGKVFAYDGLTRNIFEGLTLSKNMGKKNSPESRFDNCYSIPNDSFVIRNIDPKSKRYALRKVSPNGKNIQFHDLGSVKDVIFSTDGVLLYNKQINQIVYVYYYKNCYIQLDYNLKKISSGNTIDTLSNQVLQTGVYGTQKITKLLGTPVIVNKRASTFSNKLYIQSGLKADNEDYLDYNNKITIDIYNLSNQKYIHSISIEKFQNKKLSEFKIVGNRLAALFENYLVIYDLTIVS